MHLKLNPIQAKCLVPLAALWLASVPAQAQTAPAMAHSASMPMGQMQKQALNMAEMELAHGKSSEMKAMAKQIIVAQKKEIAQFDQWLAKQK